MDSEKSEALLQWVRLKQIRNIKEIQINCDIYVILCDVDFRFILSNFHV